MSEKMITPILEKIRPLIEPLSAEERLTLIQAIATLVPVTESAETSSRRQQLVEEQTKWYARPLIERRQYQGQYVALKDGEVIDQDQDQRSLVLRVKAQLGQAPVAILFADWEAPPTYTIHSPRLERK